VGEEGKHEVGVLLRELKARCRLVQLLTGELLRHFAKSAKAKAPTHAPHIARGSSAMAYNLRAIPSLIRFEASLPRYCHQGLEITESIQEVNHDLTG
jgi:hypothetical protein